MSKDKDGGLNSLATGFRKRTLVTAKLASKMGLSYAKKMTGLGGDVDKESAINAAEALVRDMDSLKGLVLKMGQMASYLPGAIPPEAQRVLTRLQSQTTALDFAAVEQVFAEQFGKPADQLFEEFSPTPFAAASIGQVHRGVFEGTPVAVKIQYPGIAEALASDLKNVGRLSIFATMGSALDGPELIGELRDRMQEECDYRGEARNQAHFSKLLGRFENTRVPRVVRERSSEKILTTEFVAARDFQSFADHAPQAEKDRAAATIFEACFGCIFGYGVYNADPHPGNYLFDAEGRVVFLDFGCVRRFSPKLIRNWKAVAHTVLAGDRRAFRDRYVELGFVPQPNSFDWDYQWEVMQYLYQPFLQTTPFAYSNDYVRKSYDLMIFKNPNNRKTAMPAEWLFLNRLQWGLNSILALLGATGPWGELWRGALALPSEGGEAPKA
jgi:predicted unusual protein kinase regulating ubiquinone biosynthesis (AarF/ABC1/UbiB family)